MLKWILSFLMVATVVGCKAKKTEPKECARAATTMPTDFSGKAQLMSGAVKTSDCSTLAVGLGRDGQPVISRYDSKGNADTGFGQNSVYQPLLGRFIGYTMTIDRLVILPKGYLVLGSYVRPDRSSDILAFVLKESGVMDLDFGPHFDGIVSSAIVTDQSVSAIGQPAVGADAVSFTVDYAQVNGVVFTRGVRLSLDGRDPMNKGFWTVPMSCDILNYAGFSDGVTFTLAQSSCSSLVWTAQGSGVNENFSFPADGTVVRNSLMGEFSVHYQDMRPKLISRDGMGHLREDFMTKVGNQNVLCGKTVRADRQYLVMSRLAPGQAGWLNDCWFM